MELVGEYLFRRYVLIKVPLSFPDYLLPENKWENAFWITKEGECVYPWEMDDRHLVNTVRLIHRTSSRLQAKYEDCGAHRFVKDGFYIYYHHQRIQENLNHENKKKSPKKKMGYSIPRDVQLYCDLWTDCYLYMLMRREIKLRGLEDHL